MANPQQDFVATYGPLAQDVSNATGIDASVVLGIAAQETGWGQHISGNNIFGISPTGPSGQQVVAQYPSTAAAGQAYVNLMQTPRYSGIGGIPDADQQALAITKAGYNSVDPTYANKVVTLAKNVRQIGFPAQSGSGQQGPAASGGSTDPYVQAGEAVTSGAAAPPSPASAPDPYVSAGEAVTAPQLAAAKSAPQAPSMPMVAPHLAPDGSGAMTNLSDADYTKFQSQGTNQPIKPPPDISGGIPTVRNFINGTEQGLKDVAATGVNIGKWVDDRVPALAAVDNAVGINNAQLQSQLTADRQAYEASPEGQSIAGGIGRFAGNIAATAPLMGPLGSLAAGGAGALAGSVAESAPWVARGINGLTRLASGTAAAPGMAIIPRLAVRGASMAANGALQGAGYGALTSGGSNQPFDQNLLSSAKAGALLGPVMGAGMSLGNGVRNAVEAGWGTLTGSGARNAVDAEINAAMARSRGAAGDAPSAVQNPLASYGAAPGAPGAPAPAAPAETPTGPAPLVADRDAALARPTVPNPLATAFAPAVTGSPTPRSAGASASSAADLASNPMTPAQQAASRAAGFSVRMSNQARLGYDDTEYVPGSRPTLAEVTADPELAAKQRQIAAGSPEAAALDRNNNEARLEHFDNLAGTPTITEGLKDARAAQAEQDLTAAFRNKGDADAQPVVDQIHTILGSRVGKLPPVADAMNKALSPLYDAEGKLETDPELLYGARQNIGYLMSKTAQQATPGLREATSQLAQLKDSLDSAIEAAAPGYKQYLTNYAEASRPIDAQETLQSYRNGLMGADGTIPLSRVNAMMKSIGQKLSAPGVNPAKSLTDDQVGALFDLRSDLMRQNNRNLARPAGSDTAHNLSVQDQMGMHALHAGAHFLAAHIPGGNLLVSPAIESAARVNSAKAKAYWTERLLTPPPPGP